MFSQVFPAGTLQQGKLSGEGDTPYNGLYGEAPPERGTLIRLQVYKRVGNSLVEVDEREGKSVISVCKKSQGPTDRLLMAVKKLRKGSGFVIYSYLKDSAFTAVKRRANQLN